MESEACTDSEAVLENDEADKCSYAPASDCICLRNVSLSQILLVHSDTVQRRPQYFLSHRDHGRVQSIIEKVHSEFILVCT